MTYDGAMRAAVWLSVLAAVACSSKASGPAVTIVDPRVELSSHRRGTVAFSLVDGDGAPLARDVAIRIDIKHEFAKCSLFGKAAAADFQGPHLQAKIPVEVRTRGGGGCGYGEITNAAMTVSVSATETATEPLATLKMPPQQLVVPDHRPKPLPALDTELAELATALAPLESAKLDPCTPALVAAVDKTRPLEGVELDVFRTIADPKGSPTYWSRMRSSLFSRLSRYRKLGETKPLDLLAELRMQSHVLLYAVTADVEPAIVGSSTFEAGHYLATAYLIDRAARTAVCSFPISATNSSVVGSTEGRDHLARIKTELQYRIVDDLHGKLAALSKKLQPPDAPKRMGDDPARLQSWPTEHDAE